MTWKVFGAVLILFGCASFGFSLTVSAKKEEAGLRQLISALDYMQCELQYRLTPLPQLCLQAGLQQNNRIGAFFLQLSEELETQLSPNVAACVNGALFRVTGLPKRSLDALEILGSSLGRFDVEGQIQGLEAVRSYCRTELESMAANREERFRNWQTLGVCAGAALAILFV